MTRKEILGLLAPSIVFVSVAVYLFLYADFYAPGEKDQLRAMQQKTVAVMVRKIESGEYPQKLECCRCFNSEHLHLHEANIARTGDSTSAHWCYVYPEPR
jgi:hypothetical protein